MATNKKTVRNKVDRRKVDRKKADRRKVVKKKTRASKPLLGHDPLAWLAEDESEEPVITDSVTVVEEPAPEEPAPEEPAPEEQGAQIITEQPEEEPVPQAAAEQAEEEPVPQGTSEPPENKKDAAGKGNVIDLPSGFGIAQVDDFYERFKLMLDSRDCIQINAGDVGVIDAAALQLLLAVRQQADHDGKTIEWLSVSDKLRSSAAIINVFEQLGFAE